jgi:hypothetical protein
MDPQQGSDTRMTKDVHLYGYDESSLEEVGRLQAPGKGILRYRAIVF